MAKTMCKLAKDLPNNKTKYSEKVIQPTYLCLKCGRVANKEKNICNPELIVE